METERKTFPRLRRLVNAVLKTEPIMLRLSLLLALSIGCLGGILLFTSVVHHNLEQLLALQERHRTVCDVSLIISKNVSRMQAGFQRMLLASSRMELDSAEDSIRESTDTVRKAAVFIERGGVFVEIFKIDSGYGDTAAHEFTLDLPVSGLIAATRELRVNADLLEGMVSEYRVFAEAGLKGEERHIGSAELIAMHKELAPIFEQTTEHANHFYVQSMRELADVEESLQQAEKLHSGALALFVVASMFLLSLLGVMVIRSAAKVLAERASARQGLVSANELLEERVAARTEALAASEERLRDIALTSGDIIWQTDGSGNFTYLAGKTYEMLGVTEDACGGFKATDFMGGSEEGRRCLSLAAAQMRKGKPLVDFVCPMGSHLDGKEHYFLINAIPVTHGPNAGGYFGVSKDISEKREHEARLRLFEKIFESAQEGITVTDADGTILITNPAFSIITGYTPEEARGQNPRILRSEHHPREFYQAMWKALLTDGIWTGELWNRRKSGEAYPEWLSITAVRDESGATSQYIAVFHDITAMKDKEQEILRIAYYDQLTGLPNRTMLMEKFGVALLKAEKTSEKHAVVYVDLDNFKVVNDSLGHEAGDELLVEVGSRFRRLVRADDVVSRLGGDEFVFLLGRDRTTDFDPLRYSDRIKKALAAPVRIKGQDIYVTPSIGIALYPEDGTTIQALLKHADLAMYEAKSMGKNQFRLFDETMTVRASARLTLESRLRHALGHKAVFPLFQPKIDLRSGDVIGVEALARWAAEDGSIISPLDFIPVAEETGLIVALGRSILEQSCAAMVAVRDKAGRDMTVAVNVSARQFRHESFVEDITRTVDASGLSMENLELEITESLLLGDMGQVGAKLSTLSRLGATISIDDFGTGYSSLSYLSQLPIDRIKIDRSFVTRLRGEQSDVELLQAIIQMGKSLRLRVLAEGIENAADARTLAAMGCDEAQGYHFGRPMPLHELIAFIRQADRG